MNSAPVIRDEIDAVSSGEAVTFNVAFEGKHCRQY